MYDFLCAFALYYHVVEPRKHPSVIKDCLDLLQEIPVNRVFRVHIDLDDTAFFTESKFGIHSHILPFLIMAVKSPFKSPAACRLDIIGQSRFIKLHWQIFLKRLAFFNSK